MRCLVSSLLAVLCILPMIGGAQAASPLVDAAWVKANADRSDVVVLDVRNASGGGSREAFEAGHVPGAVYSNYRKAGWRAKVDGIPGQLPPVADLETLIGGLGIGNDDHVVVVASGTSPSDMGSATRIYFTFKVLGHDKVSVLDGGYRAYAAEPGAPVETGWNEPVPKTFTAALRSEMLAGRAEVKAALDGGGGLIDFRPTAQYRGEKKHPAAKRAGTIPGAASVPESTLLQEGGRLISATRMTELLDLAGLAPEGDRIAFCNTGHWASLGWFVNSEILGNKQTRLYDGSMVDWTAVDAHPLEKRCGGC